MSPRTAVELLLPELLKAVDRGDQLVPLGDGSFGILPEDFLEKYGLLARLGRAQGDHVRFTASQAGLLDVLLAARPEIPVDEIFTRAREELRRFDGIQAAAQPENFVGQLRGYQCEGLAWMYFLQRVGFGGCLADDMGVGKTAQVLALLEERRAEGKGPSLVVAPKSLMFNWRAEAAKFTPGLRVLEHTGGARDAARFKAIARHTQAYTNVWYSAYPRLTVRSIDNNSAICEDLFKPLDERATRRWLWRF